VQNREVFAVPGNITSRNSFGTNYLIKGAGAKLVQTWQDIVAEFPAEIAARILPPGLKEEGKERAAAADVPADLAEGERRVWPLLPADEPVHIDALAEATGLPVSELAGVLLGLEMRELVRQVPGKCFVRKM
jgi:DNA processing protein